MHVSFAYALVRHVQRAYAPTHTRHVPESALAHPTVHRARPSTEHTRGDYAGWRSTSRLRSAIDRIVGHVRELEQRTARTTMPTDPLQCRVEWDASRKHYVCAFAGVSHLHDLLLATAMMQRNLLPGTSIMVHTGVLCAAVRLLRVVCDALRPHCTRDNRVPVVFTGHSMGGSVACVIAHWFATVPALRPYFAVRSVVTFGCFPFCHRANAPQFTVPMHHIAMGDDPVVWETPARYVLPGLVYRVSTWWCSARPLIAMGYDEAAQLYADTEGTLPQHEIRQYTKVLRRGAMCVFETMFIRARRTAVGQEHDGHTA